MRGAVADVRTVGPPAGTEPRADDVYAVIVSYQCRDHLSYSIPSLLATEQRERLRIVLVDNASTDGTSEFVRSAFPSVTILRLRRNRGFTGGSNAGISYALRHGATLIGLFNADIRIHPAWLRAASAVMAADPRIAGVGFAQLGGLRSGAPPPGRWPALGQVVTAQPRSRVSGACLCLRPRALEHVGLFDRGYRTFAEEIDLYLRLRKAGFRLVEVSVPSWHLNGGYWSRRRVAGSYRLVRSMQRFGIKHWPVRELGRRYARLARLCCSAAELDMSYRFHLMLRDQPQAVRCLIFVAGTAANVIGLPRTLIMRWRCAAVPPAGALNAGQDR